ncbi:T9SS type A sorting domain-containing protein [Lacinutrix iliipiscaria]|uniref:T9SS type A sorting domain-containing protein n=1 Tax=Lacinutrix iliipiscaria TaxID=1230532 RepID=A0ABW5WPB9_9FLAO
MDLSQNTNLTNLRCSENSLNSLDLSNNVLLEYVTGFFNNITHLDLSQNGLLNVASFGYNDLIEVNAKNGKNERIYLDPNANLAYLCIDENDLNSLDQVPENVVISSYCNFTPGGNYNTITGQVFFDVDSDGCNIGDVPALNTKVEIYDGTEYGVTYVDEYGNYTFYVDSGSFTVVAKNENYGCFDNIPTLSTVNFENNFNNSISRDFCLSSNTSCIDVEIVIIPNILPRPGFDASYQLVYHNKSNETVSGNIEFNFDDSILDYISSSIPLDNQVEGGLFWNYSDLTPFETRVIEVTLNVNGPTETPPVDIDDTLVFLATIEPIEEDQTPIDNFFKLDQLIRGSFDPNDKTCLEGESLEPEMIGEYLHYNINFENTGTAAATFVVVKDVIDESMFDMNTLQVMFASHEMVTNITGNKVEFIFDNINLEPEDKGNVLFKIKTLNSLAIDDSVTNSAEIFFDYNFPIETNTTTTTFETLSVDEFEWSNAISMFPNPVRDVLEIKAEALMELISVYDVQGRKVFSKIINASNTSINVSNFTSGIYFLNIQTNRGEQVEKIIKN